MLSSSRSGSSRKLRSKRSLFMSLSYPTFSIGQPLSSRPPAMATRDQKTPGTAHPPSQPSGRYARWPNDRGPRTLRQSPEPTGQDPGIQDRCIRP